MSNQAAFSAWRRRRRNPTPACRLLFAQVKLPSFGQGDFDAFPRSVRREFWLRYWRWQRIKFPARPSRLHPSGHNRAARRSMIARFQ